MNQPQNRFAGAPPLPAHHPAPTPVQEPVGGYAARPVLSRVVPTLTVYADGLVNLNTEGSALFAAGVCLHQPPAVRTGRIPQPWQISSGTCYALLPVSADKPAGSMRFRARAEECPPVGRYSFAPLVGQPNRFLLVPA